MKTLDAINVAAALLQTAMNAMTAASQVSGIIAKAQQEGRSALTADEINTVRAADDVARRNLVDAIADASPVN